MKNIIKTAILGTIAASTLLLASGAAAQQSRESERNRTLIAQGMQAWADGTGSPYDLLAENARWTITGNSLAAKTYPSKEAFMGEVIRPFNARMRERLIPKVHRLYAEGDTVVAHFDARGVAQDGKPYVNSYAWILRMEGGQIVEAHAFFDSIAFDDLWKRVTPVERP
jgi:ketosteroid isomerase-like protein